MALEAPGGQWEQRFSIYFTSMERVLEPTSLLLESRGLDLGVQRTSKSLHAALCGPFQV